MNQFPATKVLTIDSEDDLILRHADLSELSASTESPGRYSLQEEGEGELLQAWDELTVAVPADWVVKVRRAQGDVQLDGIRAVCHLFDIRGDLTVREAGQVEANSVAGDVRVEDCGSFTLKSTAGDLFIQGADRLDVVSVAGDAYIRDVQGSVRLHSVGGDLKTENCLGEIVLHSCGGDAKLVLPGNESLTVHVGGDLEITLLGVPDAPETYRLGASCGGDMRVNLPLEMNARVIVHSGGRSVQLTGDGNLQRFGSPKADFTLGEGKGEIHLSAGGEVRVTEEGESLAGKHPQSPTLDHGLPEHFTPPGLEGFINEKIADGLRTAQTRISEMLERMDSRAARRENEPAPDTAPVPEVPVAPAQPPVAPVTPPPPPPFVYQTEEMVSAEEKQIIERMLAQRRITEVEAQDLLNDLRRG